MNFGSIKKLIAVGAILMWGAIASAESFVEFIILDKVWPDHKWGHVSLRVKTDAKDYVYDFGRYGKMWGNFNTEGEPILRVWKNANDKHTKFQKAGNPTIHVIRFQATKEQAENVMQYFTDWMKGVKAYQGDNELKYFNLGSPAFHSLRHNCTTMSISGFMRGFPEYDANDSRFALGDGLYWWARPKASGIDFDSRHNTWVYIWWPKDLLNLLQQKYVRQGLAEEIIL